MYKDIIASYKKVFSSDDGKIVLKDLISKGGILKTSFVDRDPQGTAFNEGSRNLVLHILTILQTDASEIERIHKENLDYQKGENYV